MASTALFCPRNPDTIHTAQQARMSKRHPGLRFFDAFLTRRQGRGDPTIRTRFPRRYILPVSPPALPAVPGPGWPPYGGARRRRPPDRPGRCCGEWRPQWPDAPPGPPPAVGTVKTLLGNHRHPVVITLKELQKFLIAGKLHQQAMEGEILRPVLFQIRLLALGLHPCHTRFQSIQQGRALIRLLAVRQMQRAKALHRRTQLIRLPDIRLDM